MSRFFFILCSGRKEEKSLQSFPREKGVRITRRTTDSPNSDDEQKEEEEFSELERGWKRGSWWDGGEKGGDIRREEFIWGLR